MQAFFPPGEAGRAAVERARARLGPQVDLAVELRHRGWLAAERFAHTTAWLRGLGVGLVMVDELLAEVRRHRRVATAVSLPWPPQPTGSATHPTTLPPPLPPPPSPPPSDATPALASRCRSGSPARRVPPPRRRRPTVAGCRWPWP